MTREILTPFHGERRVSLYRSGTEDAFNQALLAARTVPGLPVALPGQPIPGLPAATRQALTAVDAAARQYAATLRSMMSGVGEPSGLQLSSPGLWPTQTTQGVPAAVTFNATLAQPVDTRWAALFAYQSVANSSGFFKIENVYDAVTFSEHELGEQIEIRHIQGGETIYEVDIVAGGLQWFDLWDRRNRTSTPADRMEAMLRKYALTQAKRAYTVLTASGLPATAYDTTGTTQVEKDVNTINAGVAAIKTALFTAEGITGTDNEEDLSQATFVLLYHDLNAGYVTRIQRALTADFVVANDTNSTVRVTAPVVPLGSPFVPDGAWYLMLAGRKNVYAEEYPLTTVPFENATIAGHLKGEVGYGTYKHVRGDANQGRQLATST